MTEFKPTDRSVEVIAAVFALADWKWGGLSHPEIVPTATDIADTLNRLYGHVSADGGTAGSGRLFVSVGTNDDPGMTFGIEWTEDDR